MVNSRQCRIGEQDTLILLLCRCRVIYCCVGVNGPPPSRVATDAQVCRGYQWCRCQSKLPLVLSLAEAIINADASPKDIIETKLSLTPMPVRAIWPHRPCCYSATPAMLLFGLACHAATPPHLASLAMLPLRLVGHTWPRWP